MFSIPSKHILFFSKWCDLLSFPLSSTGCCSCQHMLIHQSTVLSIPPSSNGRHSLCFPKIAFIFWLNFLCCDCKKALIESSCLYICHEIKLRYFITSSKGNDIPVKFISTDGSLIGTRTARVGCQKLSNLQGFFWKKLLLPTNSLKIDQVCEMHAVTVRC